MTIFSEKTAIVFFCLFLVNISALVIDLCAQQTNLQVLIPPSAETFRAKNKEYFS